MIALEPARSVCRILTPPGRAAITVVQIQLCASIASRVFADHFVSTIVDSAASAAIDRIVFGQWIGEDVVVIRNAVDRWEIQCHGGSAAVNAVVTSVKSSIPELQCHPAGDTRHAFSDLPTLEADISRTLIQTRTPNTASFVLAQQYGLLRRALSELVETVDDPESFRCRVSRLTRWQTFTKHLTLPWRVLVIGAPNVGKSSLVNAIVGFDRAIVFCEPGTTRDIVEAETVLDGWPFVFCDSAGLRGDTEDDTEQAGIATVQREIPNADLVLIVADAALADTATTRIVADIAAGVPVSLIWNKTDLLNDRQRAELEATPATATRRLTTFLTSAQTGEGIPEMLDWVRHALIPEVPTLKTPLLTSVEAGTILMDADQGGCEADTEQIVARLRVLLS
jgi:tRNA modification GTPase